ncbi:MAG: chemotaxis protein CheC [Oscillospiraceae bacterium]
MIHNYSELSPIALDCLKEIGNIGSGSAAAALSDMLGRGVDIRVPKVHVLEYEQAIDVMGGPENVITGILIRLIGDVKGMIMFLLEQSFADIVLNTFLCKDGVELVSMNEMELSALQEMGNIMAGSYLQALGQLTDLTIDMEPPSMTVDMLGAIMNVPMTEFSEVADKVLFIDVGFVIEGNTINSSIILIPEMSSLETLMKKLGVM